MNTTASLPDNHLLGSLQALRSPANVVLAVFGGVLMMLLFVAAAGLHRHGFFMLIVGVLALLAGLAGYCGVTMRQLQIAHGARPSGIFAALVAGFFAAIKVLLALLLLGVGLLLMLLVAALLFLITQIPGIGPALNYLVFPVVALLLGIAVYTLLFVALPLACACVCDGRTVLGTVASTLLVVRSRLFDIALRGLLVALLATLVTLLAAYIVTLGIATSGGVQALVQVSSHHAASYGGGGGYGGYGGYGHSARSILGLLAPFVSVGLAAAVLYFLALSMGMVVFASGWVGIFEDEVRDLDPAALEAGMRTQAERMQRTAREASARAAQLAREHSAQRADAARRQDDDSTHP